MFLSVHFLKCCVFLGPYRSDIEQHLRLPFALLGLMRLEQENGWRADYRRAGLVSVSLGHDTSFLRHMGCKRMVEIVGISQRVRENEFGTDFPVKGRQLIKNAVLGSHRVVAQV